MTQLLGELLMELLGYVFEARQRKLVHTTPEEERRQRAEGSRWERIRNHARIPRVKPKPSDETLW